MLKVCFISVLRNNVTCAKRRGQILFSIVCFDGHGCCRTFCAVVRLNLTKPRMCENPLRLPAHDYSIALHWLYGTNGSAEPKEWHHTSARVLSDYHSDRSLLQPSGLVIILWTWQEVRWVSLRHLQGQFMNTRFVSEHMNTCASDFSLPWQRQFHISSVFFDIHTHTRSHTYLCTR